jgi:hypothetical protein
MVEIGAIKWSASKFRYTSTDNSACASEQNELIGVPLTSPLHLSHRVPSWSASTQAKVPCALCNLTDPSVAMIGGFVEACNISKIYRWLCSVVIWSSGDCCHDGRFARKVGVFGMGGGLVVTTELCDVIINLVVILWHSTGKELYGSIVVCRFICKWNCVFLRLLPIGIREWTLNPSPVLLHKVLVSGSK